MKNLNGKFTCNLEIYYFYSDFLSTAWKKAKKMAEREGFEPSEACTSPHFQCGAFDHSTISPHKGLHIIYPRIDKIQAGDKEKI